MKEDDLPGGIQEDHSAVQRFLVSRKLLDGFSVIVNRDHILPKFVGDSISHPIIDHVVEKNGEPTLGCWKFNGFYPGFGLVQTYGPTIDIKLRFSFKSY